MRSVEDWTHTASVSTVADRIRAAIDAQPNASVCVVTHAKADGDATGSTLAIARAVEAAGGSAVIVHQSPFPEVFDAMSGDTQVLLDDEGGFETALARDASLVVVVDTGSWNQLPGARAYLEQRSERAIIIDHHRSGDAEITSARLIETDEPAACSIVAKVAVELLQLDSAASLPIEIATPIYLGLATDTGWFKHPSMTSGAFRLAGELLDAGVDHNRLYLSMEQSDPAERLWLVRAAMNSLELHADGRIATMGIEEEDFRKAGALREHTGGIIDIPKTVTSVEVSVLAYPLETEEGVVAKVSMRSKSGGADVDVNRVAGEFGGGGHKHAAGCKIALPLTEALVAVVARLREQLP